MSLAQNCSKDCSCSYIEEVDELAWPFSFRQVLAKTNQSLSIFEDEETFTVKAAVPGVKEEDIEITFEKNALLISGKAKAEDSKNTNYFCRMKDSFDYCLTVPADLDDNQLPKADCTNGIVKIVFQKQKKNKAIKIPLHKES